jgi:hypothetical protein
MAEKNSTGFLKIILIIYSIVCIVYGLGYLLVPDFLVNLSGGEEVFHGWLRWAGGILVALGTGAILVYLKPKNQGIFVTTMALGCALAGLALLWAWIKIEEGANVWFTAMPAIIVLIVAVLLWWSRQKAHKLLYPE